MGFANSFLNLLMRPVYKTSRGNTFQKTTVSSWGCWKVLPSIWFPLAIISPRLHSTVEFGEESFSSTFCLIYCIPILQTSHMSPLILQFFILKSSRVPAFSFCLHKAAACSGQLPLSVPFLALPFSIADETAPVKPKASLASLATAAYWTENFRELSTVPLRAGHWVVAANLRHSLM